MTDLTDRMRTCAAHLLYCAEERTIMPDLELACRDAADLLVKGATEIELLTGPVDLGERIEIIEPLVVTPPPVVAQTSAMWIGDDLRPIPNAPRSRNACPKCDSRAGKTVKARNETIWLECAVCGHAWIAR